MSSPATTAFLAAWRRHDARRVTLAKIELTVPSSRTIRYATTEIHTPDGSTWQTGLSCEPLRHSVPYLGAGVAPAEATMRLAKRRDASQTSGTIHDLLSDFLFQNAVVTLYLWEQGLTNFADALQVFQGVIARPAEVDAEGVTFHMFQSMTWNKQTPPTVVDKVSYPDSPDVSQGLPIPIIYGDHRAPAMRSPWGAAYTNKSKQEDAGAGIGVVPLVLVDAGVGAASVKAVAAGHLLADLLDRTNGYTAFIVGQDTLAPLDTAGITESLGASESYLSVADENAQAFAAVIPIDVRASENTATDPRRAMDPFDETTFATLNQNTGKNELQLILPNLGALGRIESVQYSVAWSGNAGNGNNLRIRSRTPGIGFGASTANWVATATTPAVQVGTWNAADYTQSWDFGGGATVFDVRIDFTGGATNQARIYWVVLVVKYRPQRSLVTPGASLSPVPQILQPLLGKTRPYSPNLLEKVGLYSRPHSTILPTFRLDSQFYANLKGYKDDGSGTFTGVAAALIERPPDIARHFLETYGLVSSSDIETGASDTGSFVLARSVLRNAQPTDLKLACWIGERTSVQRVLQAIAEQSGMCIYLDRFTNLWLCFVWKPGAAPDYGRTLTWHDVAGFTAEETSVVGVRHAIRVKYGFDYYKSKTLYEAFVTPSTSGQGLNLPTIRDQRLTVSAGVNDDLDFQVGGVFAVTLSAATYTPVDLADHIRGLMRVAQGSDAPECGYGFSIKAGVNDVFSFIVAGTPFDATLNPGDYTAEGLCTELARAMNAVLLTSRVFSWVYDHSTNKFTVSATGGTFQIDGTNAGAGWATSANHVVGNFTQPAAASSHTAARVRYGDRFWFGLDQGTTFNMLFASGANAATNCAHLLGFDKVDTGFVSNVDDAADYSRGDRERSSDTLQGYYGPREEQQVTADFIRDEGTAVQLRNRIFDMTGTPRVMARFSSFRIPDVRVMNVLDFDSELDSRVAYPKYGSDGSWVGKPIRVLEVEQNLGPAYHTEVLAIGAE